MVGQRGEGKADSTLGEAIDRRHGANPEAVRAKACREATDGMRTYRFRSVSDHAQGTKVQTGDLRGVDAAQAELKGEVRRRRQCSLVSVDGP